MLHCISLRANLGWKRKACLAQTSRSRPTREYTSQPSVSWSGEAARPFLQIGSRVSPLRKRYCHHKLYEVRHSSDYIASCGH